jgi:glutathione S-transferase
MFMKQEPDAAAFAAGEKTFHQFAPILNAQLETRKFITGDEVTLADFSVGACFSFAEPAGLPWDGCKEIKSWWGRMNEIAAWKNTAPKLGGGG